MQDYKKDCIELHDLTSEDVSEIEDITDNWEDIRIYDNLDEIVESFLIDFEIVDTKQVENIMRFLDIEGYANYIGLSHDVYELSSSKIIQTF